MTPTKRLLVLAACGFALAAVLLFPASRWRLIGWTQGDAFYRGLPTSYWRQVLQKDHSKGRPITAPPPAWWTCALGYLGHEKSRETVALWHWDNDEPEGDAVVADPAGWVPSPNSAIKVFVEDTDATPVLVQLLKDESADIRSDAAQALGEIGPGAKKAAPSLEQVLADSDPRSRVHLVAYWALKQIDPQAAAAPGMR